MKKINKYLFGAFAALLTAGLFSCVETAPEYEPGTPDVAGCNGLYFPTQEASGDHTIDPTKPRKFIITVKRDSLKGVTNPLPEVEFPLVSSDTTGVFVVPATAKFADGQQETTFDVTFEKAEIAVKYPLNISIEDTKYGSVYNSTSNYIDLSVFCVEWKYFLKEDGSDKALFSFVETMFDDRVAQFYLKYYEVDGVRHCVTVSEPSSDGEGIWGTGAEYELEFLWYTKTNYIYIPAQYTGAKDEDGTEMYVSCEAGFYEWYRGADYYTSRGYANAFEWLVKNYPDEVCFYDGHGGLDLYTYYICNQDELRGYGWSFGTDEIAIAESYVRVDYSISVAASETVDGVVPVAFELGADVTAVKYVVAEGELSAKEAGKLVDAIVANEAENIQTLAVESTDTIIGVSPAASGIYTLVAVSYAGNDAKENDYVSFTYVAAADKEEYAAVVTVATEPTSAMYEHVGLNAINSFAYYVYGEGLTAVKVGVFKTADVEAKGAETLATGIKKAVDEETLAAINGAGFADLATGLDALTSYTVVVWATNDYNSTVTTAQYETDGLPNEPTGTVGTYTYSQFWEGDDPDLALLINPNYANTYAIGNWGAGIEMGFTWDKETNKCFVKDQFTGYTHSTYGEVWVDELGDYTGSFDGDFYQSYYDPETETFHFNVIYYVSAGYFGYGEETFKLGAAAGANGRRMMSLDVPATNVKAVGNHGKIHYNVERNPQTVAVKAVKVERPARPNRFSAPVKMDNQTLKF